VTRGRPIAALALLIFVSAPPRAQALEDRGAFVIRAARDTISLERFERSGDRLRGSLVFRLAGLRFDYTIALAPDGTFQHLDNAVRQASAPGSQPTQSASLDWKADSIIADVQPGGVQRLRTRPGSMAFVNPSILMLELIARRARASGLDSVPVFNVAIGRTVMVTTRSAGDTMHMSLGSAEFVLRVTSAGGIVSGSVPVQGVTFERVDNLPESMLAVAKPDYSAPPGAPYTAESVQVPARGGFTLAGTLTRPKAGGRLPAVVTITGSGQEERDEALPIVRDYRPFRQIADTLSRRGIAVLRLDDRAAGESGGSVATATSEDFANDIEDALRWLGSQPGIDSTRLALLGHSEGGLIAPMIAARGAKLRGMVLLAGPAWNGRRILEYQNREQIRKKFTGAALDSASTAAMHGVDSLSTAMPWVGYFVGYDPLRVARKLAQPPVLILQGATDRQITAEQATELAKAFRSAGNKDVTVKVLPATNHLFLPDPSGDPAGYSKLAVNQIPRATLGIIADWLAMRLGR